MKKITLKSLAIAFFALATCFSLIACGESVSDSGTTSLGKTEKLADAISEAGMEYRYSVSVTKGETVQNYFFMRNGDDYYLEKSGASSVDLYYVANDGNPYIVSSSGTAIVKLVKGDTDYARALGSFLFAKVDNLSSGNYIATADGFFEPSDESALKNELFAFLGTAYESCEKISVAISPLSGRISTVRLEFSADGGTVCEMEFYSYDSAKFTVPSVEEYSTISAVYDAEQGQTVEVKGVVVGVVGNSFYLSDGVCGVYVYSSSSTGCAIGDRVGLSGTVEVFQGLTELKNPSGITVLDRGCSIAAKSVEDLDGIERYLSMNIDVGGLSVVGSVSSPTANENYSVTVSDGTNEITLFLSKYLPSETRTAVYNALKNLKSNSAFSLQDVVVGCFKSYQLEFTESTVLTVTGGTPSGIKIDKTQITLATGTALSNINEKITVYLEYDNGAKSELSSSDFVLECDDYDSFATGSYTVKVVYGDFSATLTVNLEKTVGYSKLSYGDETPIDSAAAEKEITRGLPSIGNPKVLVIPVDFTDYGAEEDMKSDLQAAFFGTSKQTGWESLSSYYHKSSYGKLNITGTVTDVYHTNKSSSYYSNKYDNRQDDNPEYEIIKGALEYFDDTIDYAQYDSDNDGMIDALYIVYTAPVSYSTSESAETPSDFWWAFTYEYYTEDYEYHDGKEADFYMFFGYDFLFETPACGKKIALNCETIIHETGHVLGLDDYYDYGTDHEEDNGGLGGGDMMDYNVGDHNPFSKMLLGWTDPYVARADCAITLRSFGESGDCVMICKNEESPFSEYFIIDYYTPDGLNEFEAGNSGLFSTEGVRVYHVNATMTTSEVASIWDIYEYSNGTKNAKDKLIALVEADGNNDIEDGCCSDNDDLYSIGKGSSIKGLKWRNGSSAGFVVNIARAANGSDVTLTISFN